MKKAQRNVVLSAAIVVAAMLVFPPWETHGGHYLGHALFISPPGYDAPSIDGLGRALSRPEPVAQVSLSLLALQLAALWISAGGAFLLLGRSGSGRAGGPA